jgi:hypothetical protein
MSETISGEIDWRATLFGTRAPGWSILVRFLVGQIHRQNSLGPLKSKKNSAISGGGIAVAKLLLRSPP